MNYAALATLPADKTIDSGALAANTNAVAQIAAPGVGKRILVLGVSLSANGTPGAAVTATLVDDNAVNRGRWLFSANAFIPFEVPFSRGRLFPENVGCTLTLPGLGVGIIGAAQIHYTLVSA